MGPTDLTGLKRITLLLSQIVLMGFAAYIAIRYIQAVQPNYAAWMGAISLSDAAKLILGPSIAFFLLVSSYAIGRLLWTRLGGFAEFPSPGTGFIILATIGISVQAVIGWISLSLGWSPSALIFFIALVILGLEIKPTIENLRSAVSHPLADGESWSRKSLTWLLWPMLFCVSLTPFIWGNPAPPAYLEDPAASFKLTIGHSPIGLDIPLFAIYARMAGPWAANAVNLALIWLIILGMLEAARRLFSSLPAGLLGGVLFLCIPLHFELLSRPSGEIVLALFLMASYSALVWYLFDGQPGALPLAGFFMGLALAISSKGIIFAAIFLLYAVIGSIRLMRRRPFVAIGILIAFAAITIILGSLLMVQNRYLAGGPLYPVIGSKDVAFQVPEPPQPKPMMYGRKPSKAKPIPPDMLEGVDFPTHYGAFAGVGYKMTMSTHGDLEKGPQGLGPFFMAFIPGVLLIMITRRHTLQAWTLIMLLLVVYLFWAYVGRIVSLRMLYPIFPFQALLTGYIIDRLYLLSRLEEKRPISYIFLIVFVPAALFAFIWTCPGFGLR